MSQGSSVFHAESRALMNERVRSATPQETRPPCRMKVTVAPALFGPMANVGFLEQIWRVKPNWSTTLTERETEMESGSRKEMEMEMEMEMGTEMMASEAVAANT